MNKHKSHSAKQSAENNLPTDKIKVRLAKDSDLDNYHKLCEEVTKTYYLPKELGYKSEDFNDELFRSDGVKSYFKDMLHQTDNNRAYVAELDKKLVGGITIRRHDKEYEVLGMYVSPFVRGKGVGVTLWNQVEKELKLFMHPVFLYEFASSWGTLNLYFTGGFKIDPNEPYQLIQPDWLNNQAGIAQYRLVRNITPNKN